MTGWVCPYVAIAILTSAIVHCPRQPGVLVQRYRQTVPGNTIAETLPSREDGRLDVSR